MRSAAVEAFRNDTFGLLLGTAVFGLVHYRQRLGHCGKTGWACRLFGETVRGENCSTG